MTFKAPRMDLPVLLGQRAHGGLLATPPSPRLRSSAPPLLPTPSSPRNAPITAAEANGRAGGQPRWSPLLLAVARQPPRRPRARTCRRKTLSGFSAPRPPVMSEARRSRPRSPGHLRTWGSRSCAARLRGSRLHVWSLACTSVGETGHAARIRGGEGDPCSPPALSPPRARPPVATRAVCWP